MLIEYAFAAHQLVMPGLVPGIHLSAAGKNVDGRDKPGHDGANGRSELLGGQSEACHY